MPDRARYGDRQAALLHALQRGDPAPPGFVAADVTAAGAALTRKRTGAVRAAWPALAIGLGDSFGDTFADFASGNPPPASGDGLADGLAFAIALPRNLLTEAARIERQLARAEFASRGSSIHRRRGPYLSMQSLHAPRRLLIVAALPGLGALRCTLPLALSETTRTC
jgi:hypothetical protein